jgi:hypothetical protein
MAGKPNLPDDDDQRPDRRGAATRATPGLTALDQQREASMADEGGASGMVMESEDESAIPVGIGSLEDVRKRRRLGRGLLVGAAVGAAFAVWSGRFR